MSASKNSASAKVEVSEKKSPWPARIIFGEPKDTDELGGKGHQRSARSLTDAIKQLAERTPETEDGLERKRLGGAIGLEGAWGSGKSSVIEIASKKDGGYLDGSYHVFTFDLWRHQTDDFRRALLEEFLQFVRDNFNPIGASGGRVHGVADNRPKVELKIAEREDEVRNRKTVTTTTSLRRLNGAAVALIMGLPLLPLAYSWLHPNIFQDLMFPRIGTLSDSFHWLIAGVVVYLVVWIVLFLLAYDSKSYPFKRNEDFTGPTMKIRGGASHLFNLSQRDQNNKVEQKIRDENPTTVEFRSVFESILEPVQKTGAKIIFVLDNIDRLPVDQVAKTWSEIRSLVSANGSDKSKAVIAVIPYDRAHISQAFPPIKIPKLVSASPLPSPAVKPDSDDEVDDPDKTNGKNKEGQNKEGDSKEGAKKDEDRLLIESDVFDKTFDRVVKVSAPVGSDWQDYLNDCLGKAFDQEDFADCREQLYRLLRYQLEIEGVHPTPRRIISYVNEIGGLWSEWRGEGIPMQTIALYVLHRNRIDRDPSVLSAAHIVDRRFERIVDDPQYQKNLAALAFNIDPDRANQVRFGISIRHALTAENGHELIKSMMDQHGFFAFFERELEKILEEWSVDAHEKIATAAETVARVELPKEQKSFVWKTFAHVASDLLNLRFKDLDGPSGFFKIVAQQDAARSTELAQSLLAQAEQSFDHGKVEHNEAKERNTTAGGLWMRLVTQLCRAIEQAAGKKEASAFFARRMPFDSASFTLGAAGQWQSAPIFDFSKLQPQSAEREESKLLLAWTESNPAAYHKVLGVLEHRIRAHREDHVLKIAELLGAEIEPEKHRHLVSAATLLIRRTDFETFEAALSTSATDGSLAEIAKNLIESDDEIKKQQACEAIVLTALLTGGEQLALPRTTAPNYEQIAWYDALLDGSQQLPSEDLQRCAAVIAQSTYASSWMLNAVQQDSDGGLLAAVAPHIWDEEKVPVRRLRSVLSAFEGVEAIVGQEAALKLLRKVRLTEDQIAGELFGGTVLEMGPKVIQAISDLEGDAPIAHVLALIETYLANMNETEWVTAFTETNSPARAQMVQLIELGRLPEVGEAYRAALLEVARQTLDDFDPLGVSSKWKVLLKALPQSLHREFLGDVTVLLLKTNLTDQNLVRFLAAFGPLARDMKFGKARSEEALFGFFAKIKRSKNAIAIEYLRDMQSEVNRCRKSLGVTSQAVKDYDAIGTEEDGVGDEEGKKDGGPAD